MSTAFYRFYLSYILLTLAAGAITGPQAHGAGAAGGPGAFPKTPPKMAVPGKTDRHFSPRRVLGDALAQPATPAGKSSADYEDELKAKHPWGTDQGAGVRYRAKSKSKSKSKSKKNGSARRRTAKGMSLDAAIKYARSYETLFNNRQGGQANEEALLQSMGIPNNNYGTPWTFTAMIDGKPRTVRPDGVDPATGRMAECKYRKSGTHKAGKNRGKRRRESKTRQFLAEQKMAKNLGFQLYHIISTDETSKENFPVLSSRFEEKDARFRLRDGAGAVHSWDFDCKDWQPLDKLD